MSDQHPNSLRKLLTSISEKPFLESASADGSARSLMEQQLIVVPRSNEFWQFELNDLGRCRAILDAKFDGLVVQHLDPIRTRVDAVNSIRKFTAEYLDAHITLSYKSMIDFINLWEKSLATFKIELPEGIANYRSNIGIQDIPNSGQETDPDAVDTE